MLLIKESIDIFQPANNKAHFYRVAVEKDISFLGEFSKSGGRFPAHLLLRQPILHFSLMGVSLKITAKWADSFPLRKFRPMYRD